MRVFVLLYEFLYTRKLSHLLSLTTCVILGFLLFYKSALSIDGIKDITSNVLNVNGILLGFTISILAIVVTSGNENIDKAKSHKIGVKLWKKEFSLYDKLVINLSYTIIIQGLILLTCFVIPNFIDNNYCYQLKLVSITVAASAHVVFMIIGITLDLYLIVSKQ